MKKKSFWIGFFTGALLFIITSVALFVNFFTPPDVSLVQTEVKSLNGDDIKLTKYTGKPLVINYWATWCAPCIEEFEFFKEVSQEYGDDVHFVMISDESNEKISSFVAKKNYNFDFVRSTKDLSEYGINARPATYFYDPQGKLISKHSGSLTKNRLSEYISTLE